MMIFNKAALTLFPFPAQLTTLQYRPGPPAVVKRPRGVSHSASIFYGGFV